MATFHEKAHSDKPERADHVSFASFSSQQDSVRRAETNRRSLLDILSGKNPFRRRSAKSIANSRKSLPNGSQSQESLDKKHMSLVDVFRRLTNRSRGEERQKKDTKEGEIAKKSSIRSSQLPSPIEIEDHLSDLPIPEHETELQHPVKKAVIYAELSKGSPNVVLPPMEEVLGQSRPTSIISQQGSRFMALLEPDPKTEPKEEADMDDIRPDADEITENLPNYFPDIASLVVMRSSVGQNDDSSSVFFIERTTPKSQSLDVNPSDLNTKQLMDKFILSTPQRTSPFGSAEQLSFQDVVKEGMMHSKQRPALHHTFLMRSGTGQLATLPRNRTNMSLPVQTQRPRSAGAANRKRTSMIKTRTPRASAPLLAETEEDFQLDDIKNDDSEAVSDTGSHKDLQYLSQKDDPDGQQQSIRISQGNDQEGQHQSMRLSQGNDNHRQEDKTGKHLNIQKLLDAERESAKVSNESLGVSKAMASKSPLKISLPHLNRLSVASSNTSELLRRELMNQAKQDTNSELISFYRGKRIGRGSYGTVYLVLNLHTFELMALKEVETSRFKNDNTLQEMEILQHLVHPNIVKYLGFESINGVSRLFMEYVSGGSLAATIARTGLFPEQLIRYITKQILSGLQYLHANNVIQRDIKADNILITRRGKVKISDFGVSVKDEHQDVYMRRKRTQYKGTANFMAPEAFGRDGYSAKADIWSLGCTVIEMATGGVPWKKQQSFVNIGRSIYNDHMYPPELETIESTETKQFVKKCLDFDPDTRPSALALLEDPFVMVEDSYPFKEFVDAAILRRQQERKADQRLVEITETSTSSHS